MCVFNGATQDLTNKRRQTIPEDAYTEGPEGLKCACFAHLFYSLCIFDCRNERHRHASSDGSSGGMAADQAVR